MGYTLGVDLGTTYTAAAVARDGRVDVVDLGERAPQLPSVLYLMDDGTFLVGEAALRRGMREPGRMTREFKRRLGDDTAVFLGGTPLSAQTLLGRLLQHVVGEVAAGQGGPPDRVVLTRPANWGPYRRELFDQAVASAGLASVSTVTEPEAAAIHFASTERVALGDVIATYDLGGGTFDAAVLRKTVDGFELLGEPGGLEHLGGADFDAAVRDHVVRSLGGVVQDLDLDDGPTVAGLEQLRRDCVEAKEALSSDTEAEVAVRLPTVQTVVRLSRNEFDALVRPLVNETVDCFERALSSAGVKASDLSAVVLVGGSARIPLVAEQLTARLGVPVSLSPAPKSCVALGAALSSLAPVQAAAAEPQTEASVSTSPATAPQAVPVTAAAPAVPPAAVPAAAFPAPGVPSPAPEPAPFAQVVAPPSPAPQAAPAARRSGGARSPLALVVGLLLLAAALVLAFFGPTARPVASSAPPGLTLAGAPVGSGAPIDVNLKEPVVLAGARRADIADSSLRLTVGGSQVASPQAQPEGTQVQFNLMNLRHVVGGPLRATLAAGGRDYELVLTPTTVPWWATVPGIAWIVILLFVIAYAESVQRNVRARGTASLMTTLGMNVIGLVLGVAIVLAAWTVAHRLLPPLAVVAILIGCAVAAGCLPLWLSGSRTHRRA